MTKRLTVTLPDEDYAFVRELSRQFEGNASAAVQRLVGLGREVALADAYTAALDEWEASGEADLWAGADLEPGPRQQTPGA